MVAAVQRRDEWETQAVGRMVREIGGDDPAAQLLAMLDVLDQWFNAPDFHGCMFLNTAIEFHDPRDPIHRAAAAHKLQTRATIRDLAIAAGVERGPAEVFADCYCALLEGALVLRQTHGRDDAARAIRPAAQQLIAAYIRPKPKRRVTGRAARACAPAS